MDKVKDLYQVSLKVILKNEEGKILGLKGLVGGMFSGFYDLPGGRIDTDEYKIPLTTIVAREIEEELGSIQYEINPNPVAVSRMEFLGKAGVLDHDLRVLYIFFTANYKSGNLAISSEHEDFEWFDVKQIDIKKIFAPPLAEGLQMYLNSY